jgi:hypothetical protein
MTVEVLASVLDQPVEQVEISAGQRQRGKSWSCDEGDA